VGDDTLKGLVSAAQCASTSHHVQAYPIIQVKDSDNRQAIADLAGPQPWAVQVLRQDCFKAPGEKEDSRGLAKEVIPFDGILHNCYKNRDSNLKDQAWTGQMAELTGPG